MIFLADHEITAFDRSTRAARSLLNCIGVYGSKEEVRRSTIDCDCDSCVPSFVLGDLMLNDAKSVICQC